MDETFEATVHCRSCGKRGNKNELRLNGGLCWTCRGKEIKQEAGDVKG